MTSHEIDYRILGEEMQCVEIELDPNETVVSEAGSFMMGKLMSAGKRLLTGESLFMTTYTNAGNSKRRILFAAPYPGKIIPMNLATLGGKIICQKDAFLCSAKGVSIGIEFQRKLGTGLFGGEGFIIEKLEGDGMALAKRYALIPVVLWHLPKMWITIYNLSVA